MDARILNVLLVEDHRDSALALAALVRSFGHNADIAGTCRDARQLFDAHAYDLLLCDLGLPDGDGCDLLTDLRARRLVRAVAITGYGMTEDIDRCRAAGFLTHITKPIIADGVHAILDEIAHQPVAGTGERSVSSPLAHP
jgi:CheY-like chemotaxis protein